MDEIALRKGQEDYVVVLVDLEQRIPIGFVASRKQAEISKVLLEWGREILDQIIEVSIDLSGNYKSLVQKVLPNAEIVADRFHVMKIVNEELNATQNQIKKANESNPKPVDQARVIEALKQSKYALLKPEETLTERQKAKLDEIKNTIPDLAKMHHYKESFRSIFEESKDWTDGAFQLLDWLAEAQDIFKDSVKTICRWFGEITGYFENQTTSGAVEGINNKLKLIKRSGYGFRNFDNFQLRCLICWHLHFR
jgi:transposase